MVPVVAADQGGEWVDFEVVVVSFMILQCLRKGRLHQTSPSMRQQLCDDASNSVLIEKNGVA